MLLLCLLTAFKVTNIPLAIAALFRADGRVHTLEVEIADPSNSTEAARSLERLRSDLVPTALNEVQGAQYAVGGEVAGNTDYAEHAQNKLPGRC
jgi:RND superfamily putative drug exporter